MAERTSDRALLLAFALTVVAGTTLALTALVATPILIAIVAAVGFLTSALAVALIATRRERRAGIGVTTAVGRGAKTAVRWIWEFLP